MGRRTNLSVIRPLKVNREPYVWFRTKDLNFTGTNPLSCGRAPGVGLWLRVERQRIAIMRMLEAGRLNDIGQHGAGAAPLYRWWEQRWFPPQDSVLHHHSWIGHGSALP